MAPQRTAHRIAASRRDHPAPTTWRPRQLAAQRRGAPTECSQCGALVADLGRHRAWHDQAAEQD